MPHHHEYEDGELEEGELMETAPRISSQGQPTSRTNSDHYNSNHSSTTSANVGGIGSRNSHPHRPSSGHAHSTHSSHSHSNSSNSPTSTSATVRHALPRPPSFSLHPSLPPPPHRHDKGPRLHSSLDSSSHPGHNHNSGAHSGSSSKKLNIGGSNGALSPPQLQSSSDRSRHALPKKPRFDTQASDLHRTKRMRTFSPDGGEKAEERGSHHYPQNMSNSTSSSNTDYEKAPTLQETSMTSDHDNPIKNHDHLESSTDIQPQPDTPARGVEDASICVKSMEGSNDSWSKDYLRHLPPQAQQMSLSQEESPNSYSDQDPQDSNTGRPTDNITLDTLEQHITILPQTSGPNYNNHHSPRIAVRSSVNGDGDGDGDNSFESESLLQSVGQRSPLFLEGANNSAYTPPASSPHAGMDNDSQDLQEQMESRENLLPPISEPLQDRHLPLPPVSVPVSPGHMAEVDVGRDISSVYSMDGSDMIVESEVEPEYDLQDLEPMSPTPATATPQQSSRLSSPVARSLSDSIANDYVYNDSDRYSIESAMIPPTTQMTTSISEDSAASKLESETPASLIMTSDIQESATTSVSQEREQDDEAQLSDDCMDTASDDCMDTVSDDCMGIASDDGMTVDDTALMSNILLTTADPLVHTINPCESQELVDTTLPCELLDKSLDATVTGCKGDKSVDTLSHEGTQVLETLMDQKKLLAADNPSTNDMDVVIYAVPTIEEQRLRQPQSPQPEQSEQPTSDEDLQHENPMKSLRVESIAPAQTTSPMEMLDLESRPQRDSLGPTPHQELTSDSLAAQLLLTIQPLLEVPLELESSTLEPDNDERLDGVAAAASTNARAAEIDEVAKMGTESEGCTIEGLDVSDKTTGGVTEEMSSQADRGEEMLDQPDGSEEGSHKDEIGNSVDNHEPGSQDEGKAKIALQGMDEGGGEDEENVDMDLETNSSTSQGSEVSGTGLTQDLPIVAHSPAIRISHETTMHQGLALLGDVDFGQTVEDSEWKEEGMEDTPVQDRVAEGQYEEENADITSAREYQDPKRLSQDHPLPMPEVDTLIQSQDISTMSLSEDTNDTQLSVQESTRDVSDLSSHNERLTSQIQHSVQPAPDSVKMEEDALNQPDSGLTSTVNNSELSDSSMSIGDEDTPGTDDPSSLSALIIEALQSTQTVSAQDTDAIVAATPPTHDLKLTEVECTVKDETQQVEPAVGDPVTDEESLLSTDLQLVASKHVPAIKEDSEKVEVNYNPIVVDECTQGSNSIDSSAISAVDISEMEEGGKITEAVRPEEATLTVEKVAESPSKEATLTAEKAIEGPSDSLLTLPSHPDIDTITENYSLGTLHSGVVAHEPVAETIHESEEVKEKTIVQVQNLEDGYPNTAVATIIEASQSATAMCDEDTGTGLSTGNSISTDVSGDMDDATSMAMEPCKEIEEEKSPVHTPAATMDEPVPMEVDQGEAVEMMSDIEMEGSPQTVPDLKSSLTETCISGDTMSQTTADDDTMVIISQDSGVSQLLGKRPISDGGDYEDAGVKVVKGLVEMTDERMESPSQEIIPFPSSSPPLQRPQVRPRSKPAIQPPRSALLDMHPVSNYRSSVLPSWHHVAGSDLALLSEMAMSRGDLNRFRREMRWQEERASQTRVRDPGMEVLLDKALGREVTLTRTQPRVLQQESGQRLGHVNEERNLEGALDLDQERKRKRDMGEEQPDQGVPKVGDTRGSRRQGVTNRNGEEEGHWVGKVQLSTDSRLALSTLKIQLLSQVEEQERLEQDRRALERTVKRAHGRIEETQREQQVVDARMQELLGRQKEMIMTLERHQVEEEEVKEVWRRQRAKSVKEIQDLVSRLKVLQGAATAATSSTA